jgi:hypothetical protein
MPAFPGWVVLLPPFCRFCSLSRCFVRILVIWLNDPSKMESLTPLTDRNAPLSHSLRREQREGGHARDEREELGSHLLLWSQLDTIAQSF